MIQVFCSGRGSGKTKKLIELANRISNEKAKGTLIYIDDDNRRMHQLSRNIRFVATNEYGVNTVESFYGMLCGVLSADYDVEYIFIDGLSNIIDTNLDGLKWIFEKFEHMSRERGINIFINENCEDLKDVPMFIKSYVA